MERKFLNQIFGVTGDFPYDAEAIERIVLLEGGILGGSVGQPSSWQENQMVVIGSDDFVEDYLVESVKAGLRYGFTCEYLSQETFWDLWLYDIYRPHYKGDPRISEHAGLSFLASIGFKWPSINVALGQGDVASHNSEDRRRAHELRSEFGYSVQEGISDRIRRNALNKAVAGVNNIGLYEVAYHIAGRINENRNNLKMEGAIDRWKADLEWLRKKFYDKSIHKFRWPL